MINTTPLKAVSFHEFCTAMHKSSDKQQYIEDNIDELIRVVPPIVVVKAFVVKEGTEGGREPISISSARVRVVKQRKRESSLSGASQDASAISVKRKRTASDGQNSNEVAQVTPSVNDIFFQLMANQEKERLATTAINVLSSLSQKM